MAVPIEMLQTVARSLQIDRDGPALLGPGQMIRARVVPPASEFSVTDIVPGRVSLLWITKGVRFNLPGPEPSLDAAALAGAILGGLPIEALPSVEGVPGSLGQLEGSLPIPVDVPVSFEFRWSAKDADGEPLTEGTDFIAPEGLSGPEVAFVFAPATVELTSDNPPPAPRERTIHTEVRVSAAGTMTDWIALPHVTVLVQALPIPTILALFLHANFSAKWGDDDGAVLLMVPSHSPLRSTTELQDTLTTLDTAVSSLLSFASFASFLLGIRSLSSAVAAQPHVEFRSRNRIGNLNDITLIDRPWWTNNTEAEDELSSIIFLGQVGKKCRASTDRHFKKRRFTITIPETMAVLVPSLHSAEPISEPTGALDAEAGSESFGDKLSAVEFL